MAAPLPFTGERFTPECAGGIWYEHWQRYVLIRDWVRGKVVLDAACGEGYGSDFLARTAGRVTGVDVSGEAIDHAKAQYGARSNLDFIQSSVINLPMPDASVDVIVSFETIEHLHEQEAMLAEFRRVLRSDGVLILSAPNRPVYSDAKNFRNEHHVREHDQRELETILALVFPQTNWYAQRLQFNAVIWSLRAGQPGQFHRAESLSMSPGALMPTGGMPEAMYFLVVCGAQSATLPQVADLSLFADTAGSVLKQYEQLMSWQWEARDQIARLEGEGRQLISRLATLEEARTVELPRQAAEMHHLRTELERLRQIDAEAVRDRLRLLGEVEHLAAQLRYRSSLLGWLKLPLHRLRRLFSS